MIKKIGMACLFVFMLRLLGFAGESDASKNDQNPHNPLLPLQHYIPDVEAKVYDNRIYLYGSCDFVGSTKWCSPTHYVFSAPLDDLGDWTNHGISFQSRPTEFDSRDDVPWSDRELFAPDVTLVGDTYYLAFCLAGGGIGIATSPNPEGPFTQAVQATYEDGNPVESIDPSLFVDVDGQPYLYWGQGNIRGAKLKKGADGRWTVIDQASLNRAVLNYGQHGSGEGASMIKIGDTYYLSYADGAHPKGEHAIGYSMSKKPLSGFTYANTIVHNIDCDVAPGNNHGSICKVKDQWVVFYHRQSNAARASRRVCAEPIERDENGFFSKVEMTSQGIGPPLDPYAPIQAAYACKFTGTRTSKNARTKEDREPKRVYTKQWDVHSHGLTNARNGDTAAYKYLDFGDSRNRKLKFSARVRSAEACRINVHLDASDGPIVCVLEVPKKNDGDWFISTAAVRQPIQGVHALYLEFSGAPEMVLCDIESFQFK